MVRSAGKLNRASSVNRQKLKRQLRYIKTLLTISPHDYQGCKPNELESFEMIRIEIRSRDKITSEKAFYHSKDKFAPLVSSDKHR